jgi:hypothetical protein
VRIQVIWERPSEPIHTLETIVGANDLHKDNEDVLLVMAKVRASAFFTLRFGELPRQEDISAALSEISSAGRTALAPAWVFES